jgi:hypothetical protein
MLSYFPLLQCLAIPRAIVLSHFSLLQRSGQLSHFVKWLSHFSKMLNHFAKLLSHSRDSINHSLEWLTWARGVKDGSQLGQGGARAGGGSIEGVWRQAARSCARAAELSQCGGTRSCAGWLGQFVGRVQMINSSTLYIYMLFITLVHHLHQPTSQSIESGAHMPDRIPHAPTRARHLRMPWSSLCGPIESIDPARSRPHATQPFFGVAQSFHYIVSHFAVTNSVILVHWTQPFYCNKLSHFTSLNSAIFSTLLSHFVILLQ